jgi:xanthine dehydrogenase accessory factor
MARFPYSSGPPGAADRTIDSRYTGTDGKVKFLAIKGINNSEFLVLVRGGGDLASGVAWRLHQCGFRVLITEIPQPLAVRRTVSFCEAVYDGQAVVEGVRGVRIRGAREASTLWNRGEIPVLVDPGCSVKGEIRPDVLVDAIMAKRNLGTSLKDAPLVIALGPGFEAGKDAHFVVETNRGHHLGRLIRTGRAETNTGVPGPVRGKTTERVLRAPSDGKWRNALEIGTPVSRGELVGTVEDMPVRAGTDGVLRGLIRAGVSVRKGYKVGDIDPRGQRDYCYSISDKALAIGGGVLEGIISFYGK